VGEREPGAEDALPPPLPPPALGGEAVGERDPPPTAAVDVPSLQALVEGEGEGCMLPLGPPLTEALGVSERVPLALEEVEGEALPLALPLGEVEAGPLGDTVPRALGVEVAFAAVAVAAPRGLTVGRAGDAEARRGVPDAHLVGFPLEVDEGERREEEEWEGLGVGEGVKEGEAVPPARPAAVGVPAAPGGEGVGEAEGSAGEAVPARWSLEAVAREEGMETVLSCAPRVVVEVVECVRVLAGEGEVLPVAARRTLGEGVGKKREGVGSGLRLGGAERVGEAVLLPDPPSPPLERSEALMDTLGETLGLGERERLGSGERVEPLPVGGDEVVGEVESLDSKEDVFEGRGLREGRRVGVALADAVSPVGVAVEEERAEAERVGMAEGMAVGVERLWGDDVEGASEGLGVGVTPPCTLPPPAGVAVESGSVGEGLPVEL
jgi:hypothetical protein